MYNENLWQSFIQSGKIDDYLKYKESEKDSKTDYAANYQGLDNKRADNWRE